MNEAHKPKNKKWYTHWWAIILLIICGIPFALTVVAVIVGSIRGVPKSTNTTQTKIETQVQKKTETKPSDPVELSLNVSHDNLNVVILSKESKDLGNCRLKLNDSYEYDAKNRYLVNAGQEVKIGLSNFTKSDGTRFNVYETKPKYLRIDCDRKDGTAGSADIFWD